MNAHPGLQAGCPLQCKVAGLHAVEAGTSDRFVCAHVRPNELYYGARTALLRGTLLCAICQCTACAVLQCWLGHPQSAGTWAESRCAVNRGGDGSPSTEAYACACVASPDNLFWAADPACASEEAAAATSPGVCRSVRCAKWLAACLC